MTHGTPAKIEILAPFGVAFEWMKMMLFRPFDVARWLTIAFAAFLSGNWGSGLNFRFGRWGGGDFNYRFNRHGDLSDWTDWTIPAWLIALIIMGVLLAIVLALAWMWVSSRGQFIFTDCVVKNRAAIAEPWREYRREGNSYFLFSLAAGFAIIALTLILVLIFAAVFGMSRHHAGSFILLIAASMGSGFLWLLFILSVTVVSHFMVPVMYRRRCRAWEAFTDVTRLIFQNPMPFVLFVLFGIALAIGVAVAGTVVMCATCCVGALPYISTVLLLPAIVWLRGYKLLFLRQFGDQYDAWATVGFSSPTQAAPPAAPAG
jgi:hypothetical protein